MVSRRSNDFLRPTISRVKLFLLSRYLILGSWDRISLVLPCHLEAACHTMDTISSSKKAGMVPPRLLVGNLDSQGIYVLLA